MVASPKCDHSFKERGLLANNEIFNVSDASWLVTVVHDNDVNTGVDFSNADVHRASRLVNKDAIEGLVDYDEHHGLGCFCEGIEDLLDLEGDAESLVEFKTGRQGLEGFLSFPPRNDV